MEFKENKVAFFVLSGLIASGMGLVCASTVEKGTDNNKYSSNNNQFVRIYQETQQNSNNYEIVPMYGVPQKPEDNQNRYIFMTKYGGPVINDNKNQKIEKRQMPSFKYAPPMMEDK